PAGVAARLDASKDLGAGRRLRLEVAPDDGLELLEAVEDGEVELGEEVGGEDQPTVAIDDEWSHDLLESLAACRAIGRPSSGFVVPCPLATDGSFHSELAAMRPSISRCSWRSCGVSATMSWRWVSVAAQTAITVTSAIPIM